MSTAYNCGISDILCLTQLCNESSQKPSCWILFVVWNSRLSAQHIRECKQATRMERIHLFLHDRQARKWFSVFCYPYMCIFIQSKLAISLLLLSGAVSGILFYWCQTTNSLGKYEVHFSVSTCNQRVFSVTSFCLSGRF